MTKGWRHCANCSAEEDYDITYQEQMPLCGEEWDRYEATFGLDDIAHFDNWLCYRCFEENTWVMPAAYCGIKREDECNCPTCAVRRQQ